MSDHPAFIPRDEELPATAASEHIGITRRVRDKSSRMRLWMSVKGY